MFDTHFEVFLADTEESRNIHYSIRYQVYCEEMDFEDQNNYSLNLEFDNDDKKAAHFIVRNKSTNQWVGAMRLIYKNNEQLPIEKSCVIDEEIISNKLFNTVEISRLCLIKSARSGFKDIDPPHGIPTSPLQTKEIEDSIAIQPKLNRLIIWGLFYAAVRYGRTNNILNSYFMTTRPLARVLRRSGLNLINIGAPCQHKGERFPFKMNTKSAYQSDAWENKCTEGYSLFSSLKKRQGNQLASVA